MRILYIANIRLPTEKAHGVQIMKTCEAFAKAGHDVELVVPERENTIREDAFAYYGVTPVFKITKLPTPDLVRFGRIGFGLSAIWFSERARMYKEFWRADIIYSRDASILLQYVLLGRCFVYEAHGAPTLVSRVIARLAYRVVAISKAIGRTFVQIGVPEKKVIIAPDGVDLEAFAYPESKETARARLGLPLDRKIVLYIGRLDGWKGVDTLCEAAAFLSNDAMISVIGGEPEQITMFSARYPYVRFLGFHPYRELADNQVAADVLVLPNTGKSEISMHYTSPLKLFTYMASGVPIVTSDTPATREILTDEDAYFFRPDDPQSLAESVQKVFANTEQSQDKAQRAREKVQEYTWAKRAEHIAASLLESRKNDYRMMNLLKLKKKITSIPSVRNFLDDRIIRKELSREEYTARRYHPMILDLGAHKGYASEWFATRYQHAVIHSYEPNPKLFESLKRRMRRFPQVTVFNEAVGTTEGEADLYISARDWSSSLYALGETETVRVAVTTLARVVERIGGDDILLKIDIEGEEFDVLKGIPEAITEIVGEVHPKKAGRQIEELYADLQNRFTEIIMPDRKGIFRAFNK